jgi:hypothetical protein
MEITRRAAIQGAAATLFGSGLAAGCGDSRAASAAHSLRLSSDAWHYDATNDVYYQLVNYYVAKPAAKA